MNGNDRLNPTIFHPRYVHLKHLRNETIKTIRQLTAEKKDLLLVKDKIIKEIFSNCNQFYKVFEVVLRTVSI